MSVRYLYDWKNPRSPLYVMGDYIFSTDGQCRHWVKDQYGYSYTTQEPTLWFDGKYVYGLKSGGSATSDQPLYYFVD